MNDLIEATDTSTLQSKDFRYQTATLVDKFITPDTSKESSVLSTVSSSKVHGIISIRTIPTSVYLTANDKQTAL